MAAIVDTNDLGGFDFIEVKIKDETYKIPLGGELPPRKIKALKTDEEIVKFLEEFIPKKEVEKLTTKQLIAIMQTWADETKKAQGVTPGES